MNAERLHVIAKALQQELGGKRLQAMQQLASALQQAVAQPQQPQFQDQVVQHRDTLYTALESAPSNEFGPAWQQAVKDMGIAGILGTTLKERLEEIFQRNQITPSAAHSEIQALVQQMEKAQQALEQLLHGLQTFNIGSEDLLPSESELGILIPSTFVRSQFGRLGNEFKELDKIFRVFPELVEGQRPPFVIRTISTTDLVVVVVVGYHVAACIAKAISWVLDSYAKILDIRQMRQQLAKLDMPDEIMRRVSEEADTRMDTDINEMADRLLDENPVEDEGRRNELRTELRHSLKKIAGRIDRGFNIEVRVNPESLPEPTEDEPDDEETARKREAYGVISSTARRLQYRKMEGEPILSLPEPEDDDDVQ